MRSALLLTSDAASSGEAAGTQYQLERDEPGR